MKVGLDFSVVKFFSSYLVNRKTQYVWNNFSSHFVDINVGVGQGLALSPILLALYLALFLHILEKCLKNLNLQISLLSFIDDSLLITQSKSLKLLMLIFFVITTLLLIFLPNSVFKSNTQKLKCSTSPGYMAPSTLLPLISHL